MKSGQIGQMSFLLLSVQDDATRFGSCQHFIGCNPEECLSERSRALAIDVSGAHNLVVPPLVLVTVLVINCGVTDQ